MQERPDISVVIPVAGRFEYLARSLVTLLRQPSVQGQVAAEIIVVDNARTRHEREATKSTCIRQLALAPAARISFQYVTARHANPRHRSPGFARNVGIRLARAPIVLCADADVLHVTPTMAQHLAHHHNESDMLLFGLMRDCDPVVELTPDALRSALGDERFELRMASSTNWFGMMSFSARRDRLLELGGFEERFSRLGYEDYDLARRMILAGTKVIRDDRIETLHQVHPRRIVEQWIMKAYAGLRQIARVRQANRGREWGRTANMAAMLRSADRAP